MNLRRKRKALKKVLLTVRGQRCARLSARERSCATAFMVKTIRMATRILAKHLSS